MFCDSVTHSVVRFPIASRVGCGEQAPARRSSRALERRGSCTHSIRERVVFAEREVRGGRIPPGLALLPELRLHTLLPRHVERPSRATAQTTVRRAPSHALHAAPRPRPLPQPSPAPTPAPAPLRPATTRAPALFSSDLYTAGQQLSAGQQPRLASGKHPSTTTFTTLTCRSGVPLGSNRCWVAPPGRCGHSSQS